MSFVTKAIQFILDTNKEYNNYSYFEYDMFYDIELHKFSYHTWHQYKYTMKKENEIFLGSFSTKAKEVYIKPHLTEQMFKYFLFEHDDIDKLSLKQKCNGIGSKYTSFIPDFVFKHCGDIHDYSYAICRDKTKANKKLIDKIFLYNMLKASKGNYFYKCMSFKYYLGVYLFAWVAFKRAV